MSKLKNIIRLRQWELDEIRVVLADLLRERDAMVHQIEMLEAEVVEQSKAKSLEVFSISVGAYMAGVKKKRDQIIAAIIEKDKEIDVQQEKVADGFRELKTFEIAEDQQQKRMVLEENRLEQQSFDELGIQNHARQDAVLDSDVLNKRKS
ncbi:MAG: flagellar FliJ family protein [Kordiimonadaceae bacterium]|nr:flagellar FliJ family protein [Kordiimonadaceae bacterium]